MEREQAEVLVIGGGPAGISAAIYLARYNRSAVLLDAGRGRSTHQQINHNYLGFPGGIAALELRELGRRQLAEYPHVRCVDDEVHNARPENGGFVVTTSGSVWSGQAVIVCTGVRDNYPCFDGWEACVGTSMFWCVTCDGYASRNKTILVVGHNDEAACEALQLSRFSKRITLLTNSTTSEIGAKYRDRLARMRIPVIEDRVRRGVNEGGQLRTVETEGGRTIDLDVLFCAQDATAETALARELGASVDEDGFVITDEEQQTGAAGVFAAGDVTRIHSHQITAAVHEGAQAASAANYYLYPPELKND